jgi:hypothetical protein
MIREIARCGLGDMGNIRQQFVGWRIADAMRRCADPDLLAAWLHDHRAWHAAGRPSALSRYNANGYSPRYNEFSMKIINRRDESYARLHRSLIEHLFAERIIAWGRRDTPVADPKAIPGSAWKYLRIPDIRNPVVREPAPARTRIYDVRIFPIIESPDAIDRLEGRTFIEAFQMCLVDDPQLAATRKRAITSGGTPASFGNEWQPYRAVWPVILSEDSDEEPAIGLAENSDEPSECNLTKAANRIQRQRFAKLISCLPTGRLVGEGVPAAGGTSATIPRAIWQQDGIYIDLENGALLEVPSRVKDRLSCPLRPLFRGLVLRKAESVHRIAEIPLADLRPVATRKVSKSKKNIVSKMASETACSDWLIVFMRASPNDRPEIKDFYWRKAHVKWPKSLSERGFDRAWAKAVAEATAPEWSAGGAPKKSSQAKPSQQ